MKKVLLFLSLFFLIPIKLVGQIYPPDITKVVWDGQVLRRYFLIAGDEFNEGVVDKRKWSNSFDWGRSLCNDETYENEIHYYTDGANFEFNTPGKLSLITKNDGILERAIPYEADSYILCDGGYNKRYFSYTSGMLFSKRKFKWGLFEINAKLPAGQGFWPAFWLFEHNTPTWKVDEDEIDIFEAKGECPLFLHQDVHGVYNPPWTDDILGGWSQFSSSSNSNFTNSFNTMRVVWETSGFLQWSVNQSIVYAIWPFTYQQYMTVIANVALGKHIGSTSGCPSPFEDGPNSNTSFPAAMEIDWIRVWKQLDCVANRIITSYPSNLTDMDCITGLTVTIGALNSSVDIITFNNGVDIAAINEINFENETILEGDVYARIVSCPNFPQNHLLVENEEYIVEDPINTTVKNIKTNTDLTIHNNSNPIINPSNKLNVYPNPSSSVFNCVLNDDFDIRECNFSVFDIIGNEIDFSFEIEGDKSVLSLNDASSGVYYLTINCKGEKWTQKIVKMTYE
jgi:beta-glucanase (GH16 family)